MSDYMKNRRGEESDSFFCRFTFGQFFALLVLEVFTLFFVFYLGARYGREFLGLDKIGVAVEVSQSGKDEGNTDASQVSTTTDPDAALLAKELVAKAKTPELKDRIAKMFENAGRDETNKTPPVVEINKEPQAEVSPPQMPPAEERAAQAVSPEPQAAEPSTDVASGEAKPEVLSKPEEPEGASKSSVVRVKSVENARYSVQVGSYPKMDEATRVVEKWKGKGYPAYVMIANIPDRGQWYRVRIGGFGSRNEAMQYLTEFKTRENAEALVVMNEQ